jgi:hypothetical protein
MFDPKAHLIQLPRRVKDPITGHFTTRYDEYLEVKWRLVWFREKYPHGSIITETVLLDWDKGVCIHRAHVGDGEGGMATGTGTEMRKGFEDFVEKSETRAIGRALAALGIGTQFVGAEELSEGEHVCDAPVTTTATAVPVMPHETPGMPHPLPVGEDGTPGAPTLPATNGHSPAPEHPTESHLAALKNLACTEYGDPIEVYEDRLRRTMGVPKNASVAPKLLTRTMTMQAYMEVFGFYRRLEAQLAKGKEGTPDGTAPANPVVASATQPSTGEGPTVSPSPSGSSSAPEPSPADAAVDPAYHKLYQEALGWGVAEPEIRHILGHHELAKARIILWKARRNEPPPVWEKVEASAAD